MNKNSKEKVEQLLKRYSLKKTELRINLIEFFLQENRSYSQAEIIENLEKKYGTIDRVSIYRNLNQLKSTGIIHEIQNNKYVCCSHDCETHAHVLLYCQSCEKHDEVKDHKKLNSFFKAIGNFHFLSSNQTVFLKGVCQTCTN